MPTPSEGAAVIAERLYNGNNVDFTGLQLGLFVNSTNPIDPDYLDSLNAVLADVDEPVGGGYARIAIPLSGWTVAGFNVSRPAEEFTANATGYNLAVTGAFIATTGTTPRLLHFAYDPAAPRDMTQAFAKLIVDLATILAS